MEKVKRPKSEVVKFIIRNVLRGQKIRTQAELARLACQKLRVGDEGYALSGRRARALAVQIPGISIRMETRHGPVPKRCPCCSHGLKKRFTKNLSGRKLLVRLSCPRCKYAGSGNKWVPSRYEFSMIKEIDGVFEFYFCCNDISSSEHFEYSCLRKSSF